MGWSDLFKHPDDKSKLKKKKNINGKTNKNNLTSKKPEKNIDIIYENFKKRQKEVEKLRKQLNLSKPTENKKKPPINTDIPTHKIIDNNVEKKQKEKLIIINTPEIVTKYFQFLKENLGDFLKQGVAVDRKSLKINYLYSNTSYLKDFETFEQKIDKILWENVQADINEFIIIKLKENSFLYFQKLPSVNLILLIDEQEFNIGFLLNVIRDNLKQIK